MKYPKNSEEKPIPFLKMKNEVPKGFKKEPRPSPQDENSEDNEVLKESGGEARLIQRDEE